MYKDFLSCKILLGFLALLSFFCIAEDDILQNHKKLTPHEIVKRIEIILDRPANFRTKEDLVKQQQYLDLYKKNMEIVFPVKRYSTKWFTYYGAQVHILLVKKNYKDIVNFSLWYAEMLKKAPDILTAEDFLLVVYLDLSLCGALQKDIHLMEKYMQIAKKHFSETTGGLSLTGKYPYPSMAFELQKYIFDFERINYEQLDDWDRAYSRFSEFEKIYGADFCKKIDRNGHRYLFLYSYYQRKGDLSKAEYYALENVKIAQKEKIVYTSIYLFLAERCFDRKEYKRSLEYCNYALNAPVFCLKNSIYRKEKNEIKLYLTAAKCYAALGQKEKCLEYLNLTEAKSKDQAIHKQIQNIRDKLKDII